MDKNYGEILCEAVDTIVSERLKGISFDQTIIGTIVDDSRKVEGIYTVYYNDSVKFDAYSENTGYRKNNTVYIQIPQGDWSQQKFIIGKKTNKDEEKYIYSSPFSQFLDLTNNVLNINEVYPIGLLANGDSLAKKINANVDTIPNGYTRIGLSVEFRSWLRAERVKNGHYGIRIQLTGTTEQGPNTIVIAELDSSDMLGAPYTFDAFHRQEKVFDIENITDITNIEVYLYQNNDFIDEDENIVSSLDAFGNPKPNNLWAQNIQLSFGYDLSEYDGNKLVLISNSSKTYSAKEKENSKEISLRWIEDITDEKTKITRTEILEPEDLPIGTEIYWYRYELGRPSADTYSGMYWEYLAKFVKDNENNWSVSNLNDNKISGEPNPFNLAIIPDNNLQQERIKVRAKVDGTSRYSTIIEFKNEFEAISRPTVDAIQALNLLDDNFGNYRIYNLDNSLINPGDSSEPHYLTALLKTTLMSEEEGSQDKNYRITADKITWEIPAVNTMLRLKNVSGDKIKDGKYILEFIADTTGTVDSRLEYYIAPYFSQQYSNNTIVCKVEQYKTTYTAVQDFTFGPAGTTGTEATLILDFDNNETAMSISGEKAYTITAHLYDYENNEIDLSKYPDLVYNWTWKDKTNSEYIEIINPETQTYKTELQFTKKLTAVPNNNYHILQLLLTGFGDYKLTAFLPIPIRASDDYTHIEGTTSIMYDTAGQVGNYFKNPYKLFKGLDEVESLTWQLNGEDVKGEDNYTLIEFESDSEENGLTAEEKFKQCTYTLYVLKENKYVVNTEEFNEKTKYYFYSSNFGPSISNNIIKPLSFYVKNTNRTLCAYCGYWCQPILIVQNRYPSKTINDWGGELKTDAENNTILSAKIAAGSKDNNNRFTGVILGDWDNDTSASEISKAGLYGYHEGEQSFGFMEDGTAFIGKSGMGRILFNGSKGLIESAAFISDNSHGMSLDLESGTIVLRSPSGAEKTGTILIDASASRTPFKIGTNFSVDWDGTIKATNGEFKGSIEADEGYIGGWTIDRDSISRGEVTLSASRTNGRLEIGDILIDRADSGNYYICSDPSGLPEDIESAQWGMSGGNEGLCFYAGYNPSLPANDEDSYNFIVNNDGDVYCTNLYVKGEDSQKYKRLVSTDDIEEYIDTYTYGDICYWLDNYWYKFIDIYDKIYDLEDEIASLKK